MITRALEWITVACWVLILLFGVAVGANYLLAG